MRALFRDRLRPFTMYDEGKDELLVLGLVRVVLVLMLVLVLVQTSWCWCRHRGGGGGGGGHLERLCKLARQTGPTKAVPNDLFYTNAGSFLS